MAFLSLFLDVISLNYEIIHFDYWQFPTTKIPVFMYYPTHPTLVSPQLETGSRFQKWDGAIFLTSSSTPYYCWTCCLFVLYVIGAEAPAGLLFPPLEVRQCLFVFAPRFSFYSPWKWSRLSTTSDTAGKRTLSLILSAQKLMKQLEIFVISTQNVKCCFLAWAVEYSWADPGNTHHNTLKHVLSSRG